MVTASRLSSILALGAYLKAISVDPEVKYWFDFFDFCKWEQDSSKKLKNKWAKYVKDFWRYGQLYVNFGTLKMDLAAILDHVTLN